MEILFGPAHDVRHIDPDTPNGYEWWYFDAISDDGQYTLVVIFFLGTPMSPYYKAVVDGKNPLPRDWCGVFVSLHERKQGKPWRERAYAYNLYRGGKFDDATPSVRVGGSKMRSECVDGQWRWYLTLEEPGLWRGRTQAEMTFTLLGEPLALPPVADGDASGHHWACVAPRCRVEGSVVTASDEVISFGGTGYHDHNFGTLPWRDVAFWFWTRIHIQTNSVVRTVILYRTLSPIKNKKAHSVVLLFDEQGSLIVGPDGKIAPSKSLYGIRLLMALILNKPDAPQSYLIHIQRNAYGFQHEYGWEWETSHGLKGRIELFDNRGALSEGPFYRRLQTFFMRDSRNQDIGPDSPLFHISGIGIGEVFQPLRLCGPIASRAMWTRMRRRS